MKTRIIIIAILASLVFSCTDDYIGIGCIWGNETITTETRDLNYFDGVSLEGSYEVFITQEDKSEVTIETDENLMEYIKTRVSGEILYVETKNLKCLRPSDKIKVFVSTPDIYEVNLSGSGLIQCDTLSSESLYVRISGSGDIKLNMDVVEFEANISGSGDMVLTGVADESDIRVSGSGKIQALDLLQQKCSINISGSGDARVNVEELLNVKVSGSGSVYYLGDPELSVSITGSGKVIKL